MTHWSDLFHKISQEWSLADPIAKCNKSGCAQAHGSQRHDSYRILALLASRSLWEAAEEHPSVPGWGLGAILWVRVFPESLGWLAGAAGTLLQHQLHRA